VRSDGCVFTKGNIDTRGRRYVCGAFKRDVKRQDSVEPVLGKRCCVDCTFQAYVSKFDGQNVKAGWYIIRYKPHVLVDVEPDVHFWNETVARIQQKGSKKSPSSSLLWELVRQRMRGTTVDMFAMATAVNTMPFEAKSKYIPPTYLSCPGFHRRRLTVRDRYESALDEALYVRGRVPEPDLWW
jgi:hypothetical protein